jgi:hypothetical protein
MIVVLGVILYLFIGLVILFLAERTNSDDVNPYEILIAWPVILTVILAAYIASVIYHWIKYKK